MVANLTFDVGTLRHAQLTGRGPEKVTYAFETERMLQEVTPLYPDLARYILPVMIGVGDRLQFAPAHIFTFINLTSQVTVAEGQAVGATWTVEARGRT
jgi:D-serine deaminase-like pyridoxal phosphate-dependent protein